MTDTPGEKPQMSLAIIWKGDTSRWDARRQMREAMKVIKRLEALDIRRNGKKTVKWVLTGMSKDD